MMRRQVTLAKKTRYRTMMIVTALVSAILLLSRLTSAWALTEKEQDYRPYPHQFPQVIQEFDYLTIVAVESLFAELTKLEKGIISCAVDSHSIVMKEEEVPREVAINLTQAGKVSIGKRSYGGPKTITLFATLRRILGDFSLKEKCAGVQFHQFRTRAYKRRTIIEFDFGSRVVVLDAFSNGPKDAERLYILDVIDRKDSFSWGTIG